MKKIWMGFGLAIAGMGFVNAQTADFRGFSWGAAIENVQAIEKAHLEIKIKDDELVYNDLLAGSDCNVIYIFNDNNKLVNGTYFFTKKYDNPQLYLQDYNKFKTLLTQKYGKPASERENWATNVPVSEKHNFGQAISDGNLTMNTIWTADRSIIKIMLVTVDKHPSLQIHYTSKGLDDLEDKEALKKALDKL